MADDHLFVVDDLDALLDLAEVHVGVDPHLHVALAQEGLENLHGLVLERALDVVLELQGGILAVHVVGFGHKLPRTVHDLDVAHL